MSNEDEQTYDGHGGNGETTSRRDDVTHLSERNGEKKENGIDQDRDKTHKSHKSRKHSSRSNESSRRRGSRSRKSRSRSHKRSRHSRSKEGRHKSSHRSRSRSPKKVTSIRELRAERERRKEKGDKKTLSSAIENINSVVKKKSLFDIMPGSDIPQPKVVAAPINIPPSISLHPNMIIAPKFAKSIYVGGIDPGSTNEKDLFDFFNNVINLVTGKQLNAVTTMYINKMKCFGFLEVNDYNLASAVIQQLNGVEYKGSSLSLRRPTNYDPNKAPPPGDLPMMDVTKVGLKPGKPSTYVENTSDKIYIAGIPFTVSDDQLQELLESFGPLESMCVVRERGYAFCMYKDKSVTDIACEGLNGMQVGTQALIVKRADVSQKLPGLDPVAMAAMGLGINPNTHQMNIMQSLGAQNLGLPQLQSSNALGVVPANSGYLMGGNLPNPFVGDLARPSGVDKVLKPSRILVLRNMVTEDELRDDNEYNDIKVDVQQECSSYGNVEEVVIPRPNRSYHVPGLGKIFVVFREEIDAIQARGGLEGRSFGTRKVVCEFLEEGKFRRKEFD